VHVTAYVKLPEKAKYWVMYSV